MKQEKLNLGIRRKVGSKLSFRPKNREEKELRGENGAFGTETSGFGGDVRARSAWKRPKSGKRPKNTGSGSSRDTKNWNFGRSKLGGIMLRSRRSLDRLNRTGETPNFWLPELANHRQKHKNNNKVLIPTQISKFLYQGITFNPLKGGYNPPGRPAGLFNNH